MRAALILDLVRACLDSLYLFFMVFFGFYFLRAQSLVANFPLSVILTFVAIFFANQEI